MGGRRDLAPRAKVPLPLLRVVVLLQAGWEPVRRLILCIDDLLKV